MVTLWAMIVAHPKQKWLKIVEKNVFGDFCLNNLQASSYKILPTRLFYGPLNGVHLSYDIPMVLFTIMTQYSYPMGHDDYSSMAKKWPKIVEKLVFGNIRLISLVMPVMVKISSNTIRLKN
jgi:hypothetical protein